MNSAVPATVTLKSPGGAATISVRFLGVSAPDVTAYSNELLKTLKQDYPILFNLTRRSSRNAPTHGVARLDYERQAAEDKCVELATDVVFSAIEPSLQLFDITGTVCQESASQFWPSIDAMVDTFKIIK